MEDLMVDSLLEFWRNFTVAEIYSKYPGGYLQGLLLERGILDTTNEHNLLTSKVVVAPHRKLNIGVTNLKTGELDRFTENHTLKELVDIVMASSAVPAMFPF